MIEWKGEIISDYDSEFASSYETPDNNSYGISIPLRCAMDEYGDDVRYMVVVDFFQDKEQISGNKSILDAEMKRLTELGYETFIEEVNNPGYEPVYYFVIQISKKQLDNFQMNEEYGYFFFIRSERIE